MYKNLRALDVDEWRALKPKDGYKTPDAISDHLDKVTSPDGQPKDKAGIIAAALPVLKFLAAVYPGPKVKAVLQALVKALETEKAPAAPKKQAAKK